MTANAATMTPARRSCKWVGNFAPDIALRYGDSVGLTISVPLKNGADEVSRYMVSAILCQESGQVAGWKMVKSNGEVHHVVFGAACEGCDCKAQKHGRCPCKHLRALRAALNHIGIVV